MAQNSFLGVFTFSDEQIRDINELVQEAYLQAPDFNFMHTVYPGIKAGKYIGFVGEGGLVGVAAQGCEKTPQAWSIESRQLKWSPAQWEIFLDECSKDLESSMALYALKLGVDKHDLTGTDYMTLVTDVLTKSIKKFIWRLTWFSDKSAANSVREDLPTVAVSTQPAVGQPIEGTVYKGTLTTTGTTKGALSNGTVVYTVTAAATGNVEAGATYYTRDAVNTTIVRSGGLITSGVSLTFFTLIDGFWKQLKTAVTATPSLKVTIAANAEATEALQKSALTPDLANSTLEAMIDAAPIVMRDPAKSIFYCTQSFADRYSRYLKGKGIESTYQNLVNGINSLTFDGYSLVPMPIWDEMIQKYENLNGKLNSPHRVLLIEKENLAIGTPSTGVIEDFKIWYSEDQFKNFIYASDSIDALLLNDKRFVLAI